MIKHYTESYKLHTVLGKIFGEEIRDSRLGTVWSDQDLLHLATELIKGYHLNATHPGFYAVPAFKEVFAEDLVRFYNDLSTLEGNPERLDWMVNSYGGHNHTEIFFVS